MGTHYTSSLLYPLPCACVFVPWILSVSWPTWTFPSMTIQFYAKKGTENGGAGSLLYSNSQIFPLFTKHKSTGSVWKDGVKHQVVGIHCGHVSTVCGNKITETWMPPLQLIKPDYFFKECECISRLAVLSLYFCKNTIVLPPETHCGTNYSQAVKGSHVI